LALPGAGPQAYARMSTASEAGQTSFFHVGVNPGFAMDLWPMQLTRLCRRIDTLRVTEVVDMSRYGSAEIVRDAIGFGLPPDTPSSLDAHLGRVYESPYYLSMRLLSDSLGIELDEVVYHREVEVADRDLQVAVGKIAKGTVAAMKMCLDGMVYGRRALQFELIWRVTDELAPNWPTGDSRWLLHIDGDPMLDCELNLATTYDSGRAVSLAVATLLLNSVPTVCDAAPGLINNLTLPPHSGGYISP
jgi:4-hydroxy-tetrahydrodipicolinate reductase